MTPVVPQSNDLARWSPRYAPQQVHASEEALIEYLNTVQSCAFVLTKHNGCPDWIASLSDTVRAISATAISLKYPTATTAQLHPPERTTKFLSELRELSIARLREIGDCEVTQAFRKTKEFRENLLDVISLFREVARRGELMPGPATPRLTPLSRVPLPDPVFSTLADCLYNGSDLCPVIREQRRLDLKLRKELGDNFFRDIKDPKEAARRVLRKAGVSAHRAANIVDGSDHQKKQRSRQAQKETSKL